MADDLMLKSGKNIAIFLGFLKTNGEKRAEQFNLLFS